MSLNVPLEGFGGGGTSLNFKVFGNPQPQNPKENTIWLNTDTKITGWIFSASQPSVMDEGFVWFPTGASSSVEFNALKKNGIQVYPLSAKQYVNGAFKLVDAMFYQNGTWNTTFFWVIGNGADTQTLTGGFTGASGQVVFNSGGTVTFYHAANTSEHNAHVYSKSALDVTGKTKATIKVTSDSGSTRYLGLNTPSNLGNNAAARVAITGAGTYELSIPNSWTKAHLQADFLYEGGTIVVSEFYFS